MKKSMIFLILCFMLISIIFIYHIKTNEKTEETIKLESEKLISNYKIKKELFISKSDYTTEQTTENKNTHLSKKIGTLYPIDTAPIIHKMGYKVNTESFKDVAKETKNINRNIIIEYPQLIGFENKSLQNKINKEIKNSALEPYYLKKDQLNNNDTYNFNNMKWIVEYTIEYIDKNIISIVFRGNCSNVEVEYPGDGIHYTRGKFEIYAVNINLNTGEKIRIDELLEDSFKNVLNFSKVNICSYNNILENENRYEYSYKDSPDEDPITFDLHLFDKSYNNFYIKENKFMFIKFINSADWAIAVDYYDLKDSIKWENGIW